MARVPADETAFAHRDAPVMVAIIDHTRIPPRTPPSVEWTEALHEALAPDASACTRTSSRTRARIASVTPTQVATYERLAAIKRRYDPTNFFHRNQNIRPAGNPG